MATPERPPDVLASGGPGQDGWSCRAVRSGSGAGYLYMERAPGPELARYLGAWGDRLREDRRRGVGRAVHDVLPAYQSLLIEHRPGVDWERVAQWALERMPGLEAAAEAGARHELDVAYGDQADVAELEQRLGMPFDEVVRTHADATYTVAFVGFTAGFPYLLGLPEPLHLARRERPRERTPAGAVAIAGTQAGVYPSESPGGWWVLGRTDAVLFDPARPVPVTMAPGDEVRFRAADALPSAAEASGSDAVTRDADGRDASEHDANGHGPAAHEPAGRHGGVEPGARHGGEAPPRTVYAGAATQAWTARIDVMEAWPRSLTVQGAPRRAVGHMGMAEAGALDRLAFAEANAILGNPPGAPALEALGNPVTLVARAPVRAVLTGGGLAARLDGAPVRRWQAFDWPPGASLELAPHRSASGWTTYLGVAGGFAADSFRGSPSTDVRAGIGGSRRYLAAGDELRIAGSAPARPGQPYAGTPRYPARVVLELHPGPQPDAAAFERLLRSSFRIASLDRTGARLRGPSVPMAEHETLSEGSPSGAVQIPPDGQPIVLLADRGRTGGYAKPAVVDPRDLWRLAQAGPGTEVWFAAADARTEPVHWSP